MLLETCVRSYRRHSVNISCFINPVSYTIGTRYPDPDCETEYTDYGTKDPDLETEYPDPNLETP